ncbi:MAG: oligosaccharide flippase family protein [Bacteroidales bacterium]|nr:oligosaccharide flippase family protein [Bacteroidales bacterium]
MTNSSNQIKSGAIISYIAIFFNIIAGLVYTPWMVRQIGMSDYGLYSLIGAFLSYFLIDFGLGSAIARFIAKFRVEGKENEVKNLLGITSLIYLILDFIIFFVLLVVFFFLSNIFKELTPPEIEKFQVIYVIAGFFSLISFPLTPVNGVMIAYEQFFVLKLSDLLQKVLVVALMVAALLIGQGLYALVLVNGLVGFSIKLFNVLYLRWKTTVCINFRFFDRKLVKELFSFSSWMFVIGIAQRLLLNIVPTILGILSGSTQIAIFAIAMTLEGYTWTFANALNGLFLPKVTRMASGNENRYEVSNLMIRVGRYQLIVIGLLITGIIVLGKPFINLWMGPDFIPSYYVALFLIIPGIITLTQEIGSTLLVVENEIKYRAILFIVASVLSVIIGVILSPNFGALGSAIGVGTALVLCHVIGMNIVYSKVLKLEIGRFFRSVHLKMMWPFLIAGGLCVLSQQYYQVNSWSSFVVSGSVFVLIYTLLIWNLSMNNEEKRLVKELIMNVVNKIRK